MAPQLALKARLDLTGPHNIKPVVASLQRQLNGISANIGVKIDKRAISTVDALSKKFDSLNKNIVQTQGSVASLNSSIQQLSAGFNNLGKIKQTNNSLAQTQTAMKNVAKGAKQAQTEMQKFGEQAALAVRRFTAFTVATGVIFGFVRAIQSATTEAIDFDKQLTKISQVTRLSKNNLTPLVDEITRLSVGLGVSSTELLEVAQVLAQAGLSATDTRKALEALAKSNLAPTFSDITNTTEAAIAAMAQFGIEASDLESVLGSINAVAAAFAVEAEDLTTVIRRTGGVFAAAGSQLEAPKEQLNELLALFTSVRATTRESAETIATGFRTIFSRIQRGSTIAFLRNFNIDLLDTEQRFVGVFEAVKRLNTGLSNFQQGDIALAGIIEELGGFRQVSKVIPLIQQFAKAQTAYAIAQKGQTSLTEDAEIAQESLANKIVKVKEEFLALIRSISQSETFKVLTTSILGMASALIRVADTLQPILPLITAIAGVKLVSGLTQFVGGFFGGLRGGGGVGAVGSNLGAAATGNSATASSALKAAQTSLITAINNNSSQLKILAIAIQTLVSRVGLRVKGFASGGLVPGSGNTDSVPANLMPGEFVLRKSAVQAIGAEQLYRANRRNKGSTGAEKLGPMSSAEIAAIKAKARGPSVGKQSLENIIIGDLQNPAVGGLFLRPAPGEDKNSVRNKLFGGLTPEAQNEIQKRLGKTVDPKSKVFSAFEFNFIEGESAKALEQTMEKNIVGAVADLTRRFGSGLKLPSEQTINSIMQTSGLENITGSMFETFVNAISGNVKETTGARFDIDAGGNADIGALNRLFGPFQAPYQDVKRTLTDDAVRGSKSTSLFNKMLSILPRLNISSSNQNPAAAKIGSVGAKLTGFAKGGLAASDTIPAMLTPGEFIMRKEAVDRIGVSTLMKMNKMQGFARGGVVGFAKGGSVDSPEIDFTGSVAYEQLSGIGLSAKRLEEEIQNIINAVKKGADVYDAVAERSHRLFNEVQSDRANVENQAVASRSVKGRRSLRETNLGDVLTTVAKRTKVSPSEFSRTAFADEIIARNTPEAPFTGKPPKLESRKNVRSQFRLEAQAAQGNAGVDKVNAADRALKDVTLSNKEYAQAMKSLVAQMEAGVPIEKAKNKTVKAINNIREKEIGASVSGTVDLSKNPKLRAIAAGLTERDLTAPADRAKKPGFFSRAKNFITTGSSSATPLTDEQLSARSTRRAIVGSSLATVGFLAAGQLQGKGAAAEGAATAISGGLSLGGTGLAIAGPVGAVVGGLVGVAAGIDTFLKETNRINQELASKDFEKVMAKLEESLSKGASNIDEILAEGRASIDKQIALRADPNQGLNTIIASQGLKGGGIPAPLRALAAITTLGSSELAFAPQNIGSLTKLAFGEEKAAQLAKRQGVTGQISSLASFAGNRVGRFFGAEKDVFGDPLANLKKTEKEDKEFEKLKFGELVAPQLKDLDKDIENGLSFSEVRSRLAKLGPDLAKAFDPKELQGVVEGIMSKQNIAELEKRVNNTKLVLERMSDTFVIMGAQVDKARSSLEEFVLTQENIAASFGGKIGKFNSGNASTLGNLRGSSTDEINKALANTQRAGLDSSAANLVSQGALAQKILPGLLQSIPANLSPEEQARSVLSGLTSSGLDAQSPVFKSIESQLLSIAANVQKENGDNFVDQLQNFDIDQSLGSSFKEAQALSINVDKLVTDSANTYAQSLERLTDLQSQYATELAGVIDLRANTEIELQRSRGRDPNLGTLTAGFRGRLSATGFGDVGPAAIGSRLRDLIARQQSTRGAAQAAFSSGNVAEGNRLLGETGKLTDEITNARTALDLFAKDTSVAAAIQEKLNNVQKKRDFAGDFIGQAFTNRQGLGKQLGALERFQGGDDRVFLTAFEDLRAGIELQKKFFEKEGRGDIAKALEDAFLKRGEAALGLPEGFLTSFISEEETLRKLEKTAAEAQIKAAEEMLKVTARLLGETGAAVGRASGGPIRGAGTGTSDSINARLSNGEFVLRASAVSRLGVGTLDYMNQTGELPGFASGGRFDNARARRAARRARLGISSNLGSERATIMGARRTAIKNRRDEFRTFLGGRDRLAADPRLGGTPIAEIKLNAQRAKIASETHLFGLLEKNIQDRAEHDIRRSEGLFAAKGRLRGFGGSISRPEPSIGKIPNPLKLRGAVRERSRLQRGVRSRFASGGLVNGGGAGGSIGIDPASLGTLNAFVMAANNLAGSLNALQNIPTTISMTGNHTVNVVINGAEVLNNLLQGPIGGLVQNEIQKALSRYDKELRG
jgi:TP901 family phage tail tape measure protein